MLYPKRYEKLAQMVIGDIGSVSPETTVRSTRLEFNDPWDLEEVYGVLFLDEIGEMGADDQTMLLRALEEKSFFPLSWDQLKS